MSYLSLTMSPMSHTLSKSINILGVSYDYW